MKSASNKFFLYKFWKSFAFLLHAAERKDGAGKLWKIVKPKFYRLKWVIFLKEWFDKYYGKWDTIVHNKSCWFQSRNMCVKKCASGLRRYATFVFSRKLKLFVPRWITKIRSPARPSKILLFSFDEAKAGSWSTFLEI